MGKHSGKNLSAETLKKEPKSKFDKDVEDIISEVDSITSSQGYEVRDQDMSLKNSDSDSSKFVTTIKENSLEHHIMDVDPLEEARRYDQNLWEDTSKCGRLEKLIVYTTRWTIVLLSPLMHDLILILAVTLAQFSFSGREPHDIYRAFVDSIGVGVGVMFIFVFQLILRTKFQTIVDKKTNKRIIYIAGGKLGMYQVCEFIFNFIVFVILIIAAAVEATKCKDNNGFCSVVDAYFNGITGILGPHTSPPTNTSG